MLISIIIPTFNRADQLNRTLFSLVELKTPKHLFEIIIVDNGSTDKTKEVIEKYINQNKGFTIKYFYDDIPGLLTGRHRGAKEAKGEILTFIDDDILVSETWLNTIYSVMSSRVDIGFLTGPNLPLYESYPPTWLNYFWSNHQYGKTCGWLSLLDFGNEIKEISPNYVWGLNFTVRKNVFQQLGGFHPDNISKEFQHFQGDGETGLTLKAIEQSIKALYHPDVFVYHQMPSSRLTYEYFDNRAFYQGVCNSFTTIRKENGLYKNSNSNYYKISFFHKLKHFVKTKARYVLSNSSKTSIPEDIENLMTRFDKKQQEGFEFHQKAFKENELVREWTLRDNYFDYKLPE